MRSADAASQAAAEGVAAERPAGSACCAGIRADWPAEELAVRADRSLPDAFERWRGS